MFRQKHLVRKTAFVVLACVIFSGCQKGVAPIESPAPPVDDRLYFASDEEALKAGTDAYGAYLSMSDEITSSGGLDPQRIAPYVSNELLASFVEGYESLMAQGLRSEGETTFDSAKLQSWDTDGANSAQVSFYLCIDVDGVRLFNRAGEDVTPPDRASRIPVLATIRVVDSMENAVVTENEPWSGDSFC